MPDTVGYFPYLNLWPFVRGLPDDVERVIASPRALAEYARAGRLDVAILPVVDLPTLTDRYEPLGDLGLAVAGPVWSVLLLTRRPIEALSGARICATPESSTSVRLLTLLLKVRYGVRHWRWWPTPGSSSGTRPYPSPEPRESPGRTIRPTPALPRRRYRRLHSTEMPSLGGRPP